MIFCSLVIVAVLSKRRDRALRIPTTARPASASASAMTPTVRLSLNYCTERGRQHFLDIGPKALAVDRAVEEPRRFDPVVTKRGDEGHGLPAAMRNFRHQSFAFSA